MPSSSRSTRKLRGNGSKDSKPATDVDAGAIPAEDLELAFPKLKLAIQPPYPPAEAKSVATIPAEPGWLYKPKWDGFRCLAFRSGNEVVLQSKAGQPLGRYFPEIVEALLELPARNFVLDGEIVIFENSAANSRGNKAQPQKRKSSFEPSPEKLEDFTQGLDFDALLQRIHPASSRIKRLAA